MGQIHFDPDGGGDDYFLVNGDTSTWISVPGKNGRISVLLRTEENADSNVLRIEVYRRGKEMERALHEVNVSVAKVVRKRR